MRPARRPLLVVVDTPGFLPGERQEAAGIIRHGAELVRAFAAARVPRVTVVLRKAYGGAYITMNAKALGAGGAIAWRGAEIGIMGARAAVTILRDGDAGEYARDCIDARNALRLGLVDEIVDPAQTRARICAALMKIDRSSARACTIEQTRSGLKITVSPPNAQKGEAQNMPQGQSKAEEYKALHRRVTEELWNAGNTDAPDKHLDRNVKGGRQAEGIDAKGLKRIVERFREAIPDLQVKIERQIVEGNTLVTWTTISGTHSGDVAGIRATNRPVELKGACMTVFEGDRVVEEHVLYDQLDMANQMGIKFEEGNLFQRLANA